MKFLLKNDIFVGAIYHNITSQILIRLNLYFFKSWIRLKKMNGVMESKKFYLTKKRGGGLGIGSLFSFDRAMLF